MLADWLDANGEAGFAAFLRTEIERERLSPGDTRWGALNKRASELRQFFPGVARGVSSSTRRGFNADVQAGVIALRDGLDRIGPYSTRLKVLLFPDADDENGGPAGTETAFGEVFTSSWVREWEVLEVQGVRLSERHIARMTAPGHLTKLRHLTVSGGIDDTATRALVRSELPALKELTLIEAPSRDDQLLDRALAEVAGSRMLGRLEGLSVVGNWVHDDGLTALADSPSARGLRSLFLVPRRGTHEGLRRILTSPHLSELARLDLSWVPLDEEIVSLLAEPGTLPGLSHLAIQRLTGPPPASLVRRFGAGLTIEEQ